MGFYLRKSIRFGPLRFNLSKSGIGVSGGIKGLRIGTNTRGNYVHMGRGGFYYRKTLSSPTSKKEKHFLPEKSHFREPIRPLENLEVQMEEIESANTDQMVDSSSEALIAEFNDKREKLRLRPFVTWIGFPLSFIVLISQEYNKFFGPLFIITIILFIVATIRDKLAKTVILIYDLESEYESIFKQLYESILNLKNVNRLWHISARGKTKDSKYFAGASELIKRKDVKPNFKHPPYVKTNIPTPSIPVGKQTLYFFPDKLLVFEGRKVGAVSYENLNLEIDEVRFIEDEFVPRDAIVVDHTWKYMNKKGGPDRRFKDNKELPITLYQTLYFKSNTGLNELLHISKLNVSDKLKDTINNLVKMKPQKV